MDMKDLIQKSGATLPPKIIIYGEEKIGKSTFGADAPNPFFLDFEGGLDYISPAVDKTPIIESVKQFTDWITYLGTQEHGYKTLVLDSLDWFEDLLAKELCEAEEATSIADDKCKAFGYGKGYRLLRDRMDIMLNYIDRLREKTGMGVIIICHGQLKSVTNDPIDDDHQTYELKLSKQVSAKAKEWADIILFAKHEKFITEDQKTKSKKTVTGGRILLGNKNAAFSGGGRIEIPQIPLSYKEFSKKYKELTNVSI